jgi:iron(III) transport system substrate-binding protein
MLSTSRRLTRRQALASAGVGLSAVLAGCVGGGESESLSTGILDPELYGSGFAGREPPGGTSMADLPALSGTLDVYSGRGEALVRRLMDAIRSLYPDLTLRVSYGSSSDMVNKILGEGDNSPADVFYSVNAGSLGALAAEGRARELPSELLSVVDEEFQDPEGRWVGTSGRARAIAFNTSYGSFQAFVTAMRLRQGRPPTERWLRGMLDSGVQAYPDEFALVQAVADGEVGLGFANHYYIQRVLDGRQGAPLATAFTQGDAGAVFNVAGAAVTDTSAVPETAANFVRHLLSAEAQEYFAVSTYEYPMIGGVSPVGELPGVDELAPPADIDLSRLSDLGPTIELLREVGAL